VVDVRIRYPLINRASVRACRKERSTQYRSNTSTVSLTSSLPSFRTLSSSERLPYYRLASIVTSSLPSFRTLSSSEMLPYYRLANVVSFFPFGLYPAPKGCCCRRTLRPFRLLQTPAICPSVISPSCCRRTFRPFRLLQTPAICPSMLSPSYCRRILRPSLDDLKERNAQFPCPNRVNDLGGLQLYPPLVPASFSLLVAPTSWIPTLSSTLDATFRRSSLGKSSHRLTTLKTDTRKFDVSSLRASESCRSFVYLALLVDSKTIQTLLSRALVSTRWCGKCTPNW
jgi:hypothetical protein